MKSKFLIVAAVLLFFNFTNVSAQSENTNVEENNVEYSEFDNVNTNSTKAAQVSFFYPIGSDGSSSIDNTYNTSLNLIGGINGGVDGFEAGSVFNINLGNMNGIQLSGCLNLTSGNSNGVVLSSSLNIVGGNSVGTFLTGGINATGGNAKGVYLAGGVNYAGSLTGTQMATVNVVSHDLTGAQIGVVNIANDVRGSQLGVVNVCDSISNGIPIGIVSFVRNGYFAFELGTSELLHGTIAYKMGTERFYNIFKVGLGQYDGKSNLIAGYGFGSLVNLKGSQQLAIELVANSIFHDGDNFNDLGYVVKVDTRNHSIHHISRNGHGNVHVNTLTSLDVRYKYNFTKHFSIAAGPSFNHYISNRQVNNTYGTIDVPYTIYKRERSNYTSSMWIGLNAGIIYTL